MFTGFLSDDRRVQVPERFVTEVLPAITSLAELKVTLHVFWLLGYKTGKPRCVCWSELARDAVRVTDPPGQRRGLTR